MARNWTVAIEAPAPNRPTASYAQIDTVPTVPHLADVFDAAADESVDLEFTVPAEHTGLGTLKCTLWYCANTTTAADDVRWDVQTEFKTPGAGEAMNSAAALDGTPDSATATFSTTAYALMSTTITLTPATTPAAGDHARVRVTRDANNAGGLDDLAVDCFVLAYEIFEEV